MKLLKKGKAAGTPQPSKAAAKTSDAAKAIFGSPRAVAEILERTRPMAEEAGGALSGRRVFLVGTGTSFHAALVGEHLLRHGAGLDARAVQAFEFSRYTPSLRAGDALILLSHSGAKRYSLDSARAGANAAALCVAVTGQRAPFPGAAFHFETCPQEVSQAHTVSYLGALAVLGRLAIAAAEAGGRPSPDFSVAVERSPELLEKLLKLEPRVAEAAEAMGPAPRLLYAGGGPCHAAALEGALKAREMAQLPAQAYELETALHGPLAAVEAGDRPVLLAAPGASLARTFELAEALKTVGARPWVLGEAAGWNGLPIEPVGDFWSPFAFALPLQLLGLHLARVGGKNPDLNRREDPVYEKAFSGYKG